MSNADILDPTIRSHLVTRQRRSVEDTSPLNSKELEEVQQDVGERVQRYLDFLKRVGNRDLQRAVAQHRTTIVNGVQEGIVESTRRSTRAGEPPRRTRGMDIAKAALGQRPSFLVMDNEICLEGSLADPSGWENLLGLSDVREGLRPRLAGVGLIMDAGTEALGTAFLVAPNLVMTNRHIVEQMFELNSTRFPLPFLPDKSQWYIDFTQEVARSKQSVCEARIKGLRFVSREQIEKPNPACPECFAQADAAILEIESPDNGPLPVVDLNWGPPMISDEVIVVVGHPYYDGKYKQDYDQYAPESRIAFEEVFSRQFEYKHAAPGYARALPIPRSTSETGQGPAFHPGPNLMHDASTLGGNSGSPVIATGGHYDAVGLHFWGRAAVAERQIVNLAHPFAVLADCPNHPALTPLGDVLRDVLATVAVPSDRGQRQSEVARSVGPEHDEGGQPAYQQVLGRQPAAKRKTRRKPRE